MATHEECDQNLIENFVLTDDYLTHLSDDAFSHYMESFDALLELGIQAWLTGTDRSLFAAFGEQAQFFTVSDARITRN